MSGLREDILLVAQRAEDDAMTSASAHFAAGRRCRLLHYSVGVPAVGTAAVAAAFEFADQGFSKYISVVLAAAAAVLSGVLTFLSPSELATKHCDAGNGLLSLAKRLHLFIAVESKLVPDDDTQSLVDRVTGFLGDAEQIHATSPQTGTRAFRRALQDLAEKDARRAARYPDL